MIGSIHRWALGGLIVGVLVIPTVTSHGQDRDPLDLLSERNIFDPTRQPNRAPRQDRASPEAPPPVVTVQLTGSIVYPDRAIAFFSGSDPAFNRVVSVQEQVGEFTVEAIDTSLVILTRGEERFSVPVGHSVRRRGDDPWKVEQSSASDLRRSDSQENENRTERTTKPTESAPSTSGASSDVLRRLMERRRQENSR